MIVIIMLNSMTIVSITIISIMLVSITVVSIMIVIITTLTVTNKCGNQHNSKTPNALSCWVS
jgi:hypothetical protein